MGLHTWLVLDNYLLVDPSIIIFNEKEKFLAKEIDGKPYITDIEKSIQTCSTSLSFWVKSI